MTILVVGASGATGRLLVDQLLARGESVRAVVREGSKPLPGGQGSSLSIVHASISELDDAAMQELVRDCRAVVSCLGHALSFTGIYGPPRRLVTDATRRLCTAVEAGSSDSVVKFVLMNTSGNRNRDLDEPISFAQKCIIGLLRILVPPHADNEDAADFLRTQVDAGSGRIEWVAVRPDSLIDEAVVTEYEEYPSPIRSAIFDAGKTSRINVAHFMAELVTEDGKWQRWKGQMPVLYNSIQDAG